MLCFFQKVISEHLHKQFWEVGGVRPLHILRYSSQLDVIALAAGLEVANFGRLGFLQVFSRANRRSSCKLAFDSREAIFWAWTVTLACIRSSFSSSAETAVLKSAERACRCSSRRLGSRHVELTVSISGRVWLGVLVCCTLSGCVCWHILVVWYAGAVKCTLCK